MATVETAPPRSRSHDRYSKIRPFAWMKRLANLKNSSSDGNGNSNRKINGLAPTRSKKSTFKRKDAYALSPSASSRNKKDPNSRIDAIKYDETDPKSSGSFTSLPVNDGNQIAPESNRSAAATLDTNPETINSEGGGSKTGTSHTMGGGMSSISGGGNSIFSSSNHSSRSLTTTLTTIQSNTPAGFHNAGHPGSAGTQYGSSSQHAASPSSTYFSHQYPTQPASAVPAHLAPNPSHVPTTYRAAIANNLLSDNASILTLASSSNRRNRRNSLDTDASVRAIPPSSVWGGSRESLPLSVLSHTAESSISGPPPTSAQGNTSTGNQNTTSYISQQQQRPSIGGIASAERASVYSSSGVAAPLLSSERNSVYAGKSGRDQADGTNSSIRGGLGGHGRNDSTTGSIGGITTGSIGGGTTGAGINSSSYATPKEQTTPTYGGRLSRRSSDWKEGGLEIAPSDDEDEEHDRLSDYGHTVDVEGGSVSSVPR